MERIKAKLKEECYMNWVKCVLGLNLTKKSVEQYVMVRFKQCFEDNEVFSKKDVEHLKRFGFQDCIIAHASFEKSEWIYNIENDYHHQNCARILDKVLSLHRVGKTHHHIHWENSKNSDSGNLEWVLAKVFMPPGNLKNCGPEDTDVTSMIYLMLSCKLFQNNMTDTTLKELTEVGNTLFKSSDNAVIADDMVKYFKCMSILLEEASNDKNIDQSIKHRIKAGISELVELRDGQLTIDVYEKAYGFKRQGVLRDLDVSVYDRNHAHAREMIEFLENIKGDLQELELLQLYEQDALENSSFGSDQVNLKIQSKQYQNWVKCTLGLDLSKRAVETYVIQRFKHCTDGMDVFSESDIQHLKQHASKFDECIINRVSRGRQGWVYENRIGTPCEIIFDKILSMLRVGRKHTNIYWKNSTNCSVIPLEWTLAKVFMPRGNENNTERSGFDISAIVNLMLNCYLFELNMEEQTLNELREARNVIHHSSELTVTSPDMVKHFDVMGEFLQQASDDSKIDDVMKDKIIKQRDALIKLRDGNIEISMSNEAFRVKRRAIYHDIEENASEQNTKEMRKMLEQIEGLRVVVERLRTEQHKEKYFQMQREFRTKADFLVAKYLIAVFLLMVCMGPLIRLYMLCHSS